MRHRRFWVMAGLVSLIIPAVAAAAGLPGSSAARVSIRFYAVNQVGIPSMPLNTPATRDHVAFGPDAIVGAPGAAGPSMTIAVARGNDLLAQGTSAGDGSFRLPVSGLEAVKNDVAMLWRIGTSRHEATASGGFDGSMSGTFVSQGGLEIGGIGTTNLLRAKSYTISPASVPAWPDTGGAEFTDGLELFDYTAGSGNMGWNVSSLGIPGGGTTYINVTADMGVVQSIGGVRLASGGQVGYKYEAHTLEVQTSTDGVTYMPQGTTGTLGIDAKYLTVTLPRPVQARYVRFKIGKQFASSGSYGDWLFITEGYVYEPAVSGEYTSQIIKLDGLKYASASRLSWDAVTPARSTTSLQARTSLDGGVSWTTWQAFAAPGALPGIGTGVDISHARIQYKIGMSRESPDDLFQISKVTAEIVGAK